MQNLLPAYIVNKITEQQTGGTFRAVSLFADISGFTATTEELMKHGEEGAEVLSDILKYLFNTPVKSVYAQGGFITRYAGDAFTALFEVNDNEEQIAERALQTAKEINRFFKENKLFESKFGSFEFGVKIGLASGSCTWGITGLENEKSYFFKGEAVDLCAEAEHNAQKGEIWLCAPLYQLLGRHIVKTAQSVLHGRTYYQAAEIKNLKTNSPDIIPVKADKKIVQLLAGKKESEFPVGEFREIISVFISFQETGNLQLLMETVYRLRNLYGGSHPVLDFGDKGGNILLFFGAPVAYENNDTRALNFIWQLKKELAGQFVIRAGLCKGIVYCGFNGAELHQEFTCLGNTVNQSARFMMKAEWREVWTDSNLADVSDYEFKLLGDFEFKGREGKIPAYLLTGKARGKIVVFSGAYCGRRPEIERLRRWLEPLSKDRFGGYIYIDGDAGIGKSRIIYELRKQSHLDRLIWCHLPCDDIIKAGLNPFLHFIKDFFSVNDENPVEQNLQNVDQGIYKLIQKASSAAGEKFIRSSGHLKIFLGLPSGLPELEIEEAEERYNNILEALCLFFELFAAGKRLILEFDNAQYLDADSLKLISLLASVFTKKPLVFILGCRFKDNGDTFDYRFPANQCRRLLLKPLRQSEIRELAKDRLKTGHLPILTVKTIHTKSQGNPLYTEQIIHFLTDNKIFDNKYNINGNYEIPTSLSQIIVSRIDKLKRNLKELIKAASVLGPEFPVTILTGMLTDKFKNLPQLLSEGENEDIWQAVSEINFLFKYAAVQNVVYEMQLKKTIKELHELSARTIEKTYQDKLPQFFVHLAYHYDKAENRSRAMHYLKLAGQQAKDNFQNKKAAEYFDRWVYYAEQELGVNGNQWDDCQINPAKTELLREYIINNSIRMYLYGMIMSEMQIFGQIMSINLKLINLINDDELKASVFLDNGQYLTMLGKFEPAADSFKQSAILSEQKHNYNSICRAYLNLGKIEWTQGRADKALEYYRQVLEYCEKIVEQNNRLSLTAQAYGSIGVIYDYSGKFDLALEYYHKQLSIQETRKSKNGIAVAIGNIGIIHHLQQNFTKAAEFYEKKLLICQELNQKTEIAQTLNNLGCLNQDQQKYKKALQFYKQSLKISEESSDIVNTANTMCNLGNIYKQLKDYRNAENIYDKALLQATNAGIKYLKAEILVEKAELFMLTSRKTEALELLKAGKDNAAQTGHQACLDKAGRLLLTLTQAE